MNNRKDDSYYIRKTLEYISLIQNSIRGANIRSFQKDALLLDATLFRLIQMVENIKCISAEFKEMHSEIQWGKIMGFRNGLVHEYGNVDYSIVFEIIKNDLPILKLLLESI